MSTLTKLLPVMILLILTAAWVRKEPVAAQTPHPEIIDPTPMLQDTSTSVITDDSSRMIAFTSERDGNMEICLMPVPGLQAQVGADDSEPHRLTNDPAEDYWPTWSPDGAQIAFASDRDGDYSWATIFATEQSGPACWVGDAFAQSRVCWLLARLCLIAC